MPGVSILWLHIAQWVRECVRNKGNAYQGSHAVAGRTGCSAGMGAARDRNRGAADGGGWSGPRTTLPDPGAGPEDRAVPGYVRGNDQSPRLGCRIRSEEHTSELQSRPHLVCRLLLEKKKNIITPHPARANRHL